MEIKTNNISKVFQPKSINESIALTDVSLSFKQGEYIGIIGQTGSGKTTFIEHLNALSRPSSGSVIISYNQIKKKRKKDSSEKDEIELREWEIKKGRKKIKKILDIRSKVGVVFQFAEYQLFEETIEKDISFGPLATGKSKEEAKKLARKYLELVGLDAEYLSKSPFSLSGGQKRRVALAGILAMEPDFIVLDEILKGTNSKDKAEGSYKFVERLIRSKATGLIATHDLSLCVLADRHSQIKNWYFDADIINNELYFDYKLKKGICQNMNASFLLKKMEIVD